MKSGSFEFIQSTLTVLAVVASVAAFLFVIFEFGEARGRRPLHQWLTGGWRLVTGSGWSGLAETISRAYVNTLNGIIRDYFEDADKGTVLSVLFVGLVFVLIPAAALLNLAIGGSTFLAKYYLSLLAVLVVFNFTGESRRLAVVNGAAAVYLGASVFLLIPLYVFRSFATLARIDVFPHAVPESILVAPLCYLVAYGAKLVLDSFVFGRLEGSPPGAAVTALHGFLAALPAAFVLTFVALLVGGTIDAASTPSLSWQYLISSMAFTSAGLAATLLIMGWAHGAGGAVGVDSGLRGQRGGGRRPFLSNAFVRAIGDRAGAERGGGLRRPAGTSAGHGPPSIGRRLLGHASSHGAGRGVGRWRRRGLAGQGDRVAGRPRPRPGVPDPPAALAGRGRVRRPGRPVLAACGAP